MAVATPATVLRGPAMTSWPLPQELSSWLLLLTHAPGTRQQQRFLGLVGGALFARGRRTVTRWARAGRRFPAVAAGALSARGRRPVTSWLRAAGITAAFKPCSWLLSSLARRTD